MRRILSALAACLVAVAASAQEIASFEADSTSIYNAIYNPAAGYAQAPVTTPQRRLAGRSQVGATLGMGVTASSMGFGQYVCPSVSLQATQRLRLSMGMGMAFGSLRLGSVLGDAHIEDNVRAVSNCYSMTASYSVSPRCGMYGSLVYARDFLDKASPVKYSQDRYMATFGAVFNITESLSVGVEVRSSRNMSPWDIRGCHPLGW